MRRSILIVAIACALASCAGAKSDSPKERIAALLQSIQDGKADAFQSFLAGSLMASQKEALVRAMDGQAKAAFEFYGLPTEYEIIEEKEIGTSLVRIKWITKHNDEVPMFWNALFYRRNGEWEALGILFFDDPSKAGV